MMRKETFVEMESTKTSFCFDNRNINARRKKEIAAENRIFPISDAISPCTKGEASCAHAIPETDIGQWGAYNTPRGFTRPK